MSIFNFYDRNKISYFRKERRSGFWETIKQGCSPVICSFSVPFRALVLKGIKETLATFFFLLPLDCEELKSLNESTVHSLKLILKTSVFSHFMVCHFVLEETKTLL